jgi:predicted transcriptional regulator of viral defense system
MDLLEWAEERPLFNLNQAERYTGLERDSLRVKLSRMAGRGDLLRIERGKYTVHDDVFIYASHIEKPSYISLWSALDFYGLTTQEPTQVQVVHSGNRDDLPKIEFYQTQNMFGFEREKYRGFDIFIAEKEKLLIDALSFGKIPVDELVDLVEEIDIETTVEYIRRNGGNAVSKRAGYLIQRVRGEKIEELKVDDSNYPLLDLTQSKSGGNSSEWRLKVNNDAF